MASIKDFENYNLIIVTDDKEETDEMFKGRGKVVSYNEIVDFQIIMNADIVICANSTFSFWGALLNSRAKKVIIPEYWLGFHVEKRMPEIIFESIPENWVVIDYC
jgi:predicted glycosyltransferase